MIDRFYASVPNRLLHKVRSPFRKGYPHQIVHCTYHKMGTNWFTSVMAAVADQYGLRLQWIDNNPKSLDFDNNIVIFNHSDLDAQRIRSCRGSHMIRDFRDVVVSGYFYHLWTVESWSHQPQDKFDGLSYQQHLNRLSLEEGLLAEIEHLSQYLDNRNIRRWDFEHPRFLELKYEETFGNEEIAFRNLFAHYGFTAHAIEVGVKIARRLSFRSLKKKSGNERKNSHLRSGKPGQWQELFTKHHKQVFKERLGDVLVQTGYEKDLDW